MNNLEVRRIGEEISRGRIKTNTHKMYESKVEVLKSWLNSNYPRYIWTNGDIRLPLPAEIITDFMAHISMKFDENGQHMVPPVFNSFSHVNAYRSAIMDFYRRKEIIMDDNITNKMAEYCSGYKRKVAQLKEDGELPMMEGKVAMSSTGYNFLAEIALTQDDDFNLYTFIHYFLLLCWNLMARSVSVAHIMYDHISWEEDALCINLGKTKGDQEGKNSFPRHVYANPMFPEICPILGFAIYIFCKGYQREGSSRLLFGATSQDRFSKWLSTACSKNKDTIVAMGLIISDIGTHSFRKGIATVLANQPGGPSAISIWLRAGWSLGSVQSRYIFEGAGGDQFVGRAASGLDLNSEEFAVLPPHFDQTNGPVLTTTEWEEILPGYTSFYPEQFRVAIPYLLASLIYHMDWLQQKLKPQHPLFLQRVYTSGIINKLKSKVLLGNFKNKQSGLQASGVPPYVRLNYQMCSLERSLHTIKDSLNQTLMELPSNVCNVILEHCSVNGAVPISASQISTLMTDMQKSMMSKIVSEIRSMTGGTESSITQSDYIHDDMNASNKSWTWGGRIHMVPEDFHFPMCNLRTIWDIWWGVIELKELGHIGS